MDVVLTGQTDLAGFRTQARELLAHRVPPDEVNWQLRGVDAYRDQPLPQESRPRNVARAATAIVPSSFTRLCEFVVLHRDRERFALLYRLLWRLVHEPGLRHVPSDPDMLQAQHMAHAVRRDIHKIKANLRLRPVRDEAGDELQMACYEPTHHITEAVAPWACKRIAAPRWVIFTPDRSVRFEGGQLQFGPGVSCHDLPLPDTPDVDWLDCYHSVYAAHNHPAAGA